MGISLFDVEIDRVDKAGWDRLITQFDDASIYQAWDYGAIRRGTGNLSHLVLKRDREVVGGCQVSFHRLRALNIGIAYVVWGPLWRKKGNLSEPEVFRQLIRSLKQEYAIKRRLLLRISPNTVGAHSDLARSILENEGFEHSRAVTTYRTLRLDLSPSLDDLRKNLLQKWRNHLNKAEKSGLTVIEGTENKFYGTFLDLMTQMRERKKFNPGVDYQQFRAIYENLPEHLKMRATVCESQGEPVSIVICSAMGDTGIYILGATGDKGKGLNGAYSLHWQMIKWLKQQGVRWYDLGGIDPEKNPSVYEFKLGIAGKSGTAEEFIGEFQGCFSARAKIVRLLLSALNSLRSKGETRTGGNAPPGRPPVTATGTQGQTIKTMREYAGKAPR